MSYTRTMTLEELALARLCSGEPVIISLDGFPRVSGKVVAIAIAPPDSEHTDLRLVTIASDSAEYVVPLVLGALVF
jgi:multidrug resistance efflux pump